MSNRGRKVERNAIETKRLAASRKHKPKAGKDRADPRPSSVTALFTLIAKTTESERTERPPRDAEFIFYVLADRRNRIALLGDLAEEYVAVHQRFGAERADLWYRLEVAKALCPTFMRAIRRVMKHNPLPPFGF